MLLGDKPETTEHVAAKLHRGWMGLKQALTRVRWELLRREVGRVEFDADHPEQSFQRTAAPGRSDRFMRALVSSIPIVV